MYFHQIESIEFTYDSHEQTFPFHPVHCCSKVCLLPAMWFEIIKSRSKLETLNDDNAINIGTRRCGIYVPNYPTN